MQKIKIKNTHTKKPCRRVRGKKRADCVSLSAVHINLASVCMTLN